MILEMYLGMAGFKKAKEIAKRVCQLFSMLDMNITDIAWSMRVKLTFKNANQIVNDAIVNLTRLDGINFNNRGSINNE